MTARTPSSTDWFAGEVDCDGEELITLPLAEVRRLVFAARTTGGTAGRDEELCSACEAIERHLPAVSASS